MTSTKPLPNQADQLALLRLLGFALQLLLVLFGAETFGLSLQVEALTWVMLAEGVTLTLLIWQRHRLTHHELSLFVTLLLDILFWGLWLAFSGGATNAFVTLLLIPIVLAAVTLPLWAPWVLAVAATLVYSLMMKMLPVSDMMHHGHGMDMSSHYLGMWLNFVLTALVITTTVALLIRRIRKQDAQMAYLRESQLRQEQLLALGTASAQMAHQLATPLSSMRLLLEEVQEANCPVALSEMDTALSRCEATLNELREATRSIREGHVTQASAGTLAHQLRQKILLLMPTTQLDWQVALSADDASAKVLMDMNLVPALMALVENASASTLESRGDAKVSVTFERHEQELLVRVRDYGGGIDSELMSQLGSSLISSPKGMGMALLLSHASFERLGACLTLSNHPEGGSVAEVRLPLIVEAA
ncbi:ATP-binding protein [Shewanella corallii]|uniref:histidine kinase n=1 Tax=Shewanella corallii TaxID=560080 RepID=A0ABT0N1N4_9GAMM|nr:HAMP domain-containing sensor histidine kinase [Shewanella corallii]MCL2912336.1 ATP-binding protein [Shewanella corallii]